MPCSRSNSSLMLCKRCCILQTEMADVLSKVQISQHFLLFLFYSSTSEKFNCQHANPALKSWYVLPRASSKATEDKPKHIPKDLCKNVQHISTYIYIYIHSSWKQKAVILNRNFIHPSAIQSNFLFSQKTFSKENNRGLFVCTQLTSPITKLKWPTVIPQAINVPVEVLLFRHCKPVQQMSLKYANEQRGSL